MNLWTESIWGDEGFSAIAVMRPFGEMIEVVMRDTAPPLFYVIGWLWVRLVGSSEVALRSLPLLLTVGTAIFGGLIVYRASKDKWTGVLGGLLVLGNPFLNKYAFEWRMYALLAFGVVGSTYFWLTKRWVGYVVMSLAALYTHHFALFTVATQMVVSLGEFNWKKPKTLIKHFKPYLWVGLGYIFWLYPMYLQTIRVKGAGFWLAAPKLGEIVDTVYRLGIPETNMPWLNFVIWGGVISVLVGKNWRLAGKTWVKLAVVFGGPVVIAAVVSHLVTPIFYDRYLLSVAAGLAILMAAGVHNKMKWALVILVGGYMTVSWQQFSRPQKLPFRDLAAYVKQERGTNDRLINYNGRAHHIWESKYYGIGAPIWVPGEPLPLYVGTALMGEGDTIKNLPESDGRLGVIASENVESINLPGYKIVSARSFDRLTFSWWEKSP